LRHTYALFDRTGHYPPLEEPERFDQSFLAWVHGPESSSGPAGTKGEQVQMNLFGAALGGVAQTEAGAHTEPSLRRCRNSTGDLETLADRPGD
jgi:hypothetical protein